MFQVKRKRIMVLGFVTLLAAVLLPLAFKAATTPQTSPIAQVQTKATQFYQGIENTQKKAMPLRQEIKSHIPLRFEAKKTKRTFGIPAVLLILTALMTIYAVSASEPNLTGRRRV